MDSIFWNGTNVYRNSGDLGPFATTQATLENCCCDNCPEDCTDCSPSGTLVVDGYTGDCAYLNGTFDIDFESQPCQWVFDDYLTVLECSNGEWYIILPTPDGTEKLILGPNVDGCPPESGSGSQASASPVCSGQTVNWSYG